MDKNTSEVTITVEQAEYISAKMKTLIGSWNPLSVSREHFHDIVDDTLKGFAAPSHNLAIIDRAELEALRTLLEEVTEVAQETVDQFHSAYKGYKPDRHAYYDELMTKARAAIKDLHDARASMPVKDGDDIIFTMDDGYQVTREEYERFNKWRATKTSEPTALSTVQDQGADPKQILLEALEGFLEYEGIEEFSIPYKTKRLVYSSVETN